MFSFTRGKPIARIEGGEYDKKVLHMYDPSAPEKKIEKCCDKCSNKCLKKKKKCCLSCNYELLNNDEKNIKGGEIGINEDPLKFITDKFLMNKTIGKNKKLTMKQMEDLIMNIINKEIPKNKDLEGLFNKGVDLLEKHQNTELILNDGKIIPLPNNNLTDEGQRIFVAGPSGSGKTTYAVNYIKEFKKMFPKIKDVIVFSRSDADPKIDCLEPKPMRIKIDENLIKKPIDIKALANSVCLFDDVDTIQNNKIRDIVLKLRDDINQCGRKYNIYCVCTGHQVTNYKSTRELLNESQAITFFPKSGSVYGIKYFLKNYCGLSKDEVEKIMNLPSRWVTICKTYPNYILYDSGAYIIGTLPVIKKTGKHTKAGMFNAENKQEFNNNIEDKKESKN
jgi:hypothetical protein